MESKPLFHSALIALTCVAAALPPVPPAKRVYRHAEVTQGMGAAKLIATVMPPAPSTNTFAWQYPPGINPSNYFWNIESAASVKGPWSVVVTNASGAQDVTVNRNESLRLYRLSINFGEK